MAELIQIYIRVELSSCFSMVIVNCEVTCSFAAAGSSSNGRLSHAPPKSLTSDASDAREDFLLDACDPLRTCNNALSFPPQPVPGDHFVLSSSFEGLRFLRLKSFEEKC